MDDEAIYGAATRDRLVRPPDSRAVEPVCQLKIARMSLPLPSQPGCIEPEPRHTVWGAFPSFPGERSLRSRPHSGDHFTGKSMP